MSGVQWLKWSNSKEIKVNNEQGEEHKEVLCLAEIKKKGRIYEKLYNHQSK